MHQVNLVVAICALAVMMLGLISARLQLAPLSRPILALALGALAGPLVVDWIEPAGWPHEKTVLKEAARFTLAISVMGIALRTPREDYRRLLRPVALLLTLGMLVMWLVSFGVAWAALGVSPLLALAIGSIVTPTDPVVASSIATGGEAQRRLPDETRSTLSVESGANDGLAYLIVLLPVILLESGEVPSALARWAWDVIVIGVLLAVAIGVAVGWGFARLIHLADEHAWIEKHSLLGASVALSLFTVTLAKLAGSDGILAAFAAGVAFNFGVDRQEDFEEQNVQETISKLFSLPVFVLLGAALPLADWTRLGWPLWLFGLGVLFLRRPVAMAVTGPLFGPGLAARDVAYLGWFGPVGIAAMYYALHVEERTGEPIVWAAATVTIVASVVSHGLSSGPGLLLYSRRAARAKAQSPG